MKVSSIALALAAISTEFDIGWAEETLVLHTSGRRRQEAKLLGQKAGEQNGIVLGHHTSDQHSLRLGSSWRPWGGDCKPNIGDGCLTDSNCCGEMECKGLVNWECGNTPGTEGEYCNLVYACDEDLVCNDGVCRDYADLLKKGTKETCKEGSDPGTLKVMSYNLFLIRCPFDVDIGAYPCQPESEQKKRIIPNLFNWMDQSDADVVMFQEVWSLTNEIIDGMTKAGFCHYLSNAFEKRGSGLQIFSKYPLEHGDFLDYYDFTGENSESVLDPEVVLADKGIMYVKVEKNGKSYHIANTHTLSNSLGENHDTRMGQYEKMKRFVEEKNPDINNMVLYGGDLNEDKYNHDVGDQYYKEMLEELEASDPEARGDQKYSFDTLKNPLLASFHEPKQKLLDYILVSNKHEQPEQSSCEILIPQWPLDCDGKFECMISDHFPVLCTFVVSEAVTSATF